MNNNKWSVMGIWNTQLTFGRKDRVLKPRTRIWASEIGKNKYDRYLKMTGVKPDIDYDERTLRKFAAGDFFERIIGFVLISSGLLKEDNTWYNIPEDTDHLEVSVKPDFIAGGKPDWDKVKRELKLNPFFEIMPVLSRISEALVNYLAEKYPEGMEDLLYEIKSVNSQVFWNKKDYLTVAYPQHVMQVFTGMKATNTQEGRILYISKDDLTTAEFSFKLDDETLIKKYEDDVREMTKCIRAKTPPPKPEEIIFDKNKNIKFQYKKKKYIIKGAYTFNWEVNWSMYIKTITGFETANEWKDSIKPLIKEKNDSRKETYKSKLKVENKNN